MVNPNKESKDEIILVHLIIKSKHESEKEGEREIKKKTSIKWESTQEWEGWVKRDSSKHKP